MKGDLNQRRIAELVGARVRALRQSRGDNMTTLGDVIGVNQQNVSKLELGKCCFSITQLWRVSVHYGTSMGHLLGGLEQPIPEKDTRRTTLRIALGNACEYVPDSVLRAVIRVLESAGTSIDDETAQVAE